MSSHRRRPSRRRRRAGGPWLVALLLFGLVGGALAIVIAPRYTDPEAPAAPARLAAAPTPRETEGGASDVDRAESSIAPSEPTVQTPQATLESRPSAVAATHTPVPTVLSIQRDSPLVRHDPALERVVLEVLSDQGATFGIAIKELSTRRGLLVNPELEFYAASLFKLPLMYEVFNQRAEGALRLDEELIITARHVEFDLGTLDREEGERYSVGQALERMITISDNASAIMLQDRVGASRANQSMARLGLAHTFVLKERLTTSPQDMLVFFEALARGTAIDRLASAAMVHLLLEQKVNDRLPALLPGGTPVAHKTGNWEGNVHDVGIIYAPRATIVIAVLSQGVEDSAEVAEAIARLARAVYLYFEQVPTSPVPVPADPRLPYPQLPPGTVTPTPTIHATPSPPTPTPEPLTPPSSPAS